jgi:hypothetical protein
VRRHLLPGLINAAEPFVTSGQGSEVAANRKGVRRPPSNAVQALVNAYAEPPAGVTRDMLLAFAESLLAAPDSSGGDGLAPGTFWAPDTLGNPRKGVLADKAWFDTMFPKTSNSKGDGGKPDGEDGGNEDGGEDVNAGGVELEEDVPEDPIMRLHRLRSTLTARVDVGRDAVEMALEEVQHLLEHTRDAVQARVDTDAEEEPAQVQKIHQKDISAIKTVCADMTQLLDEALLAVMSL